MIFFNQHPRQAYGYSIRVRMYVHEKAPDADNARNDVFYEFVSYPHNINSPVT